MSSENLLSSPKPVKELLEGRKVVQRKSLNRSSEFKSPNPPKLMKKSTWCERQKDNTRMVSISSRDSTTNSSFSSMSWTLNNNESFFNDNFEVICKLGQGSFGEVFKVKAKDDNKQYAVKKSKERFRNKSDKINKLKELRKHELIPLHPNCVTLYRAWEQDGFVYLQLELCASTLEEYSDKNHNIPEDRVWNILLDLLLAIRNLHDSDLIHLDIKTENILLCENGTCKLGDFGLVVDLKKDNLNDAMEGDAKYLAPELMQGNFTKAADIFSAGAVTLELACDIELPQNGQLWQQLRKDTFPESHTKHLSTELITVIKNMMQADPTKRPSVIELLELPRFQRMLTIRKYLLLLKSTAKMVKSSLKTMTKIVMFPLRLLKNLKNRAVDLINSSILSQNHTLDESFEPFVEPSATSTPSTQKIQKNSRIRAPVKRNITEEAYDFISDSDTDDLYFNKKLQLKK